MKINCEHCGEEIKDRTCINLGEENEPVCYHFNCIMEQLKTLPDRYMAELILDRVSEEFTVTTPEVDKEDFALDREIEWQRDLDEFLKAVTA